MENAVDALKIAFAVMVFTIALSLAMATFSQARETSETVLFMNDKTNYYEYDEIGTATDMGDYTQYEVRQVDGSTITYTDKRIVGIETVIPTLYRYYKENYIVVFDGIDKPLYYLDSTAKWDKAYTGGYNDSNAATTDEDKIYYFDLNAEIKANCPWVGTVNDIKKNLDLFFKGTFGITDEDKISFGNKNRKVKYVFDTNKGFLEAYRERKFLEELGEYATDRTYGMRPDGKLEITNPDQTKAVLEQNASGTWTVIAGSEPVKKPDGTPLGTGPFSLEEIATAIGSSSSTYLDPDSGEIIELAKPTIKRVIKYTLMSP